MAKCFGSVREAGGTAEAVPFAGRRNAGLEPCRSQATSIDAKRLGAARPFYSFPITYFLELWMN